MTMLKIRILLIILEILYHYEQFKQADWFIMVTFPSESWLPGFIRSLEADEQLTELDFCSNLWRHSVVERE